MLSAEDRNRLNCNVPCQDECLSYEALAVRIAQSSGKELLPLFKQVLGPLLRPEISSVQINRQGILSVIQMFDVADRQYLSEDQFDKVDVCRVINCDLASYTEFPFSLIESLSDVLPSSGETLDWLVRHFSQAGYALSMGLVTVESNHYLCIEADARDREEELGLARSVIRSLLGTAKSFALTLPRQSESIG